MSGLYGFYGQTGTDSWHREKKEAFDLLRKRGAIKAVLEFSGGNDEGGVDSIQIIFPGDKPAEDLEVFYDGAQMEFVDGKWREKPKEEASEDQKLSVILQKPVDDEFGSWAGEFEAYGTLTWDVATEKAEMDKYVSVPTSYEHEHGEW